MLDLIPDYVKQAPIYHLVVEALLVVWILWLLFRKSYAPVEKSRLTEKDKKELLDEWKPEPLVPEYEARESIVNPRVIEGPVAKYVVIDGVESLNVASFNFLNMVGNEQINVIFNRAFLECFLNISWISSVKNKILTIVL